jgi:hypothetical protein
MGGGLDRPNGGQPPTEPTTILPASLACFGDAFPSLLTCPASAGLNQVFSALYTAPAIGKRPVIAAAGFEAFEGCVREMVPRLPSGSPAPPCQP